MTDRYGYRALEERLEELETNARIAAEACEALNARLLKLEEALGDTALTVEAICETPLYGPWAKDQADKLRFEMAQAAWAGPRGPK